MAAVSMRASLRLGVWLGFAYLVAYLGAFEAVVAFGQNRAAPTPTQTLKVYARRVVVDVVVTDSKGRPVKGLKREDFRVYDDGAAQVLRSFEPHVLEIKPGAEAMPASLNLPPNTYANLVHAPEDRPVTVLLYDVLNTPVQAMPYAHQAMVKFLSSQSPGSRTAIFVLGDQLRMLEGFTDDETRLLAAINSKAAKTQQSGLLLNSATSGNALPDLKLDTPQVPVDPTATGPATVLGELNNLEQMEQILQDRQRIDATADALAAIARYVAALPGRKNLLWLSGSFPASILPSADLAVSGTAAQFNMTLNADREIGIANNLLNAAQVSVYPVDVRGLQVNTFYSAANNATVSPRSPPKLNQFIDQQNAEHSTMDTIAENTGGHAFYNTNGLNEAMKQAMEQGSAYYTLTYSPPNVHYDESLRRIRVELAQPGYRLSYRKSYVAEEQTAVSPSNTASAGVGPMAKLMQHGAPIAAELFFESSVLPVEKLMPASEKELAQLMLFQKTPAARGEGPSMQVQHYEVSLSILGRQLELPQLSNGQYDLKLDLAVAAFDGDGLLLDGLDIQCNEPMQEASYEGVRRSAYRTRFNVALPVGARWMRIGVRDAHSGQAGTIEIPLGGTAHDGTTNQ
jgi:VWFA-related protein